ncbi:MAG: RbcX chaperonin protein [Cyanothece sp. SIO1E1]|nr:RbcX chaperonin protein [Cyanothece sp. SIO1E1]
MDPKQVAQATAKVLQSYLTYQAVRTIIQQLSETFPEQAIWLSNYSADNKIQDSEAYLAGLMLENKEMMLRVLTVRAYLAENILEILPEMVRTGIQQTNIDHRRQLLERLTQTSASTTPHPADPINPLELSEDNSPISDESSAKE